MAERPILFSGPLVRAILEGRKTETRRLITGATSSPRVYSARDLDFSRITHADSSMRTGFNGAMEPSPHDYVHVEVRKGHPMEGASDRACPRILPGDTLWVREQFKVSAVEGAWPRARATLRYAADGTVAEVVDKKAVAWAKFRVRSHPSIHMPRWASRLTLKVTDVRAERLHEITEGGAQREGVPALPSARSGFAAPWDEINGKRPGAAWSDNPWVWVIKFEVLGAGCAREERREGGER